MPSLSKFSHTISFSIKGRIVRFYVYRAIIIDVTMPSITARFCWYQSNHECFNNCSYFMEARYPYSLVKDVLLMNSGSPLIQMICPLLRFPRITTELPAQFRNLHLPACFNMIRICMIKCDSIFSSVTGPVLSAGISLYHSRT